MQFSKRTDDVFFFVFMNVYKILNIKLNFKLLPIRYNNYFLFYFQLHSYFYWKGFAEEHYLKHKRLYFKKKRFLKTSNKMEK